MLLALFPLIATLLCRASANVEKVVFTAPPSTHVASFVPNLDRLHLEVLSPSQSTFSTKLTVRFPSELEPRGPSTWFFLEGLKPGQRYEVRVCWAATQPTEFWLDVFPLRHVLEEPSLISSVASYAELRQEVQVKSPFNPADQGRDTSILFLQIKSAADFFTGEKERMLQPDPVLVDIILDPYLLNVFPRSLVPTAAYIFVVACLAWYLSGKVWTTIRSVSQQTSKSHAD